MILVILIYLICPWIVLLDVNLTYCFNIKRDRTIYSVIYNKKKNLFGQDKKKCKVICIRNVKNI